VSRFFYTRCPLCEGGRVTLVRLKAEGTGYAGEVPSGLRCWNCKDGYHKTTLTDEAVRDLALDRDELLLALADASQGSPEEALQIALSAVAGRLGEIDDTRKRREIGDGT
jgi:hypothetical protein